MTRRIGVLLTALLVVLAVGAVAATPAHAAASNCWEPRVYCVWTNQSFNGSPTYRWTIPTGSGGFCVNYGGTLNDKVDSNALRGARSATQYRDANCSGTAISFNAANAYGGPETNQCGGITAWACVWEGIGSYLPSSAWIIK